jgi:hypothetical protein
MVVTPCFAELLNFGPFTAPVRADQNSRIGPSAANTSEYLGSSPNKRRSSDFPYSSEATNLSKANSGDFSYSSEASAARIAFTVPPNLTAGIVRAM